MQVTPAEFMAAAGARELRDGETIVVGLGLQVACVLAKRTHAPRLTLLLSGIAARTKKLKLGTAIYHIHGRSAVTLGIQAATLQDMSGGRLLLGLGVANRRSFRGEPVPWRLSHHVPRICLPRTVVAYFEP